MIGYFFNLSFRKGIAHQLRRIHQTDFYSLSQDSGFDERIIHSVTTHQIAMAIQQRMSL